MLLIQTALMNARFDFETLNASSGKCFVNASFFCLSFLKET